MDSSKIIESLSKFESFVFLLWGIGFSDTRIVNVEYKEILFASKTDGYDWPNKIDINVLINFYYFWIWVAIILFFDYCLFATITNKSLCINDKFNIIMRKIFFLV